MKEAPRSHELDGLLRARTATPLKRPLTAARIRRLHATLGSALGSALKCKLLSHNPAVHVELANGRRPKAVVWSDDRVAAWRRTGVRPVVAVGTAQQAGTFVDAASEHRLYPMFRLIAYRGLRRGEAVGLRWQDVDLDAGVVRNTQQVIQLGWATEVGDPKTDSGARTSTLDRAPSPCCAGGASPNRRSGGPGVPRGTTPVSSSHARTGPNCTLTQRRPSSSNCTAGLASRRSGCTTSGTPPRASHWPPACRSRSCPNSSATAPWPSPLTPTPASCQRSPRPPQRLSPTSSLGPLEPARVQPG